MTKKIKNIQRFVQGILIFILIGIVIGGCEVERNFATNANRKNNEISFEQFKKETGLYNFDTKIHVSVNQQPDQSLARNADGSYELSDFNISTDVIKKVVINEKTTYTFQIQKINEVNEDRFFNLTMFYKEGWQSIIVELKPTNENLLQLNQGLTDKFKGTMTRLYKSDLNQNTMQGCTTVFITNWHCVGGGSCDGSMNGCDWCSSCVDAESYTFCGSEPVEALPYCLDPGPIPSGGGSASIYGNGNPSTPSNDENAIATSPIIKVPALDAPEKTPCDDLKKNTADLQFRQKLNTLNKSVNFDKDHETAFIATKNGNVKGFTYLESPSGEKNKIIEVCF